MAEISNNYINNPQPVPCKFGVGCTRKDCRFFHGYATDYPRAQNPVLIRAKVQRKQTYQHPKKNETYETRNANYQYMHQPKKPELSDILKYNRSFFEKPNVEEGMHNYAPSAPGLPALPRYGKCRIMNDNEHIIYFIPFYQPINDTVYFKKIRLYRFNKNKGEYKLVFNYNKQGFHITSAAASNGYLVCSRLPYNAAVLKMMEEANRLKKQNDKMLQEIKQKDEVHARQIAKLRAKNRDLSSKNKKPGSSLRVEAFSSTQIRIETTNNRLGQLQYTIMDNWRTSDPVDLFVYDTEKKCHVPVLEYHKPADHVDLKGRTLSLWDKKTGLSHSFFITLKTNGVSKYLLDEPIQPKQLCDVF